MHMGGRTRSPRMAPPKTNTRYTLFLFISVCRDPEEANNVIVSRDTRQTLVLSEAMPTPRVPAG